MLFIWTTVHRICCRWWSKKGHLLWNIFYAVNSWYKKLFWYIFVEFAVNKAILTVTSKMTNASYLLFAYFVQVYTIGMCSTCLIWFPCYVCMYAFIAFYCISPKYYIFRTGVFSATSITLWNTFQNFWG